MPETTRKSSPRSWGRRLVREWVVPILVVVTVCGAFRSAVADWNDVPSGSMKPTILEGDRILVNKLAYNLRVPFTTWQIAEWSCPARGDIVVCFSPANGDRLVKRVVAVPGDTVTLVNNRVIINGQPLEYVPLDRDTIARLDVDERTGHQFARENLGAHPHAVMLTPNQPAARFMRPVVVPPDHYFVMGDNRDNSADSRFFGFVSGRQIVGRSSRVAFSLDYDRWYLPRWDRFFDRLD